MEENDYYWHFPYKIICYKIFQNSKLHMFMVIISFISLLSSHRYEGAVCALAACC